MLHLIRLAGIGAAALSLAACQTIQTRPAELSPAQVAVVHASVKAALKDPDSARFGATRGGLTDQGPILVCGYVNARNSFGGYTGESPYVGWIKRDGSFELRDMASDWYASPSNAVALVANCRANGVPI